MKKNIVFICISALFLWNCSTTKKDEGGIANDSNLVSNQVTLSAEEIKATSIQVIHAEKKNMGAIIRANGILDVPPHSLVTISAPMGGFVKITEVLQGMKVKRGQVIAQLEHQDYIQLQQDYLDSKIQLEFVSRDFERETELAKSNISSTRTLQEMTAKYKSLQNKVNALASKLHLIGVNANNLKEGNILTSIPVTSPIEGYITKVNVNIGKYVNPNDIMFEIVDTKHLHAEITVYEKDASYLKKDQKIKYVLANDQKERLASIFLLSHSISADRTLSIHAHLDQEDQTLMPGMYITALIETENREVFSLPQEAFVNFDGKDYIFIQLENKDSTFRFDMKEVGIGICQNGFCELNMLDNTIDLSKDFFVTKGSFDLLAKLKNVEEE